MTSPKGGDDPLIPSRLAGIVSALLTVLVSVLAWLVQLVGNFDTRLKELEVMKGHVVDEQGNVRPSNTSQENKARVRAIEAQIDLMRKKLGI